VIQNRKSGWRRFVPRDRDRQGDAVGCREFEQGRCRRGYLGFFGG